MFAADISPTRPSNTEAIMPHVPQIYLAEFRKETSELVKAALGQRGGKSRHMIEHDYSSLVPPGCSHSSADLWQRVTMLGAKSGYDIPTNEANIIDCNRDFFANLFKERPTVLSLGVGGDHAVMLKDDPTVRAVNAWRYVAIDTNREYAENAAATFRRRGFGDAASFMHEDFTKPLHIENLTTPILATMYGCTLGQYPLSTSKTSNSHIAGEIPMQELMINVGEMMGYKGFFAASIDTNQYAPTARDTYIGQHFREFKMNFWPTAKMLIEFNGDLDRNYLRIAGNPDANIASAFLYDPVFEEGTGIVHTFVVIQDIECCIDGGKKFKIPAGKRLETGVSQKSDVADVVSDASAVGWEAIAELSDGRSHGRILVFAGHKLLSDPIELAKTNITVPRMAEVASHSSMAKIQGLIGRGFGASSRMLAPRFAGPIPAGVGA